MHPIKYHDFSGDKDSNYAGFGLKSIKEIPKDETIMLMNHEIGMVSNVLLDDEEINDNNAEFHD